MKHLLYGLLVLSLATSCIPRSKLTYLQGPENQEQKDSTYIPLKRPSYRVQINDLLNISIRTYNPEVAQMFNSTVANTQIANVSDGYFYLTGYSVDNLGNITMPILGTVQVNGLTIDQVKEAVELRLQKYFNEDAIFANVQLSGIRFSVIGQVNRPGKYTIYQNQANIFEALALAGDATVYGQRYDVQLIRQYPEGIQIYELDLTQQEVLTNPNYMIQPNDIINVKPSRQTSWGFGGTGLTTVQAIAAALGIVSSAVIIANGFK